MLSRREVLLGGAAGWLGAAAPAFADAEPLTQLPGKRPLIQRAYRPPNFETPLSELAASYTPNDVFFVRYHLAVIPWVDTHSWRVTVGGDSATHPLRLSLHDLQHGFERVSLAAVNQCSGNRRGLFTPRVPGVQWQNGAMGNALWSGVRLRDVLRRAGIRPDAVEVVVQGADSAVLPSTPKFVKSLPLERALDDSTLIAFEMNGAPLPHWNGAPARLIVPGWTGTYWMKHLTDIQLVPKPFDGFWMKAAYRLPTGAFPGARFATQENADTTPITEILVNSLILAPLEGQRLPQGQKALLRGKAWDNGAGIAAVEVSSDAGQHWRPATLGRDLGRYAWRDFHLPLDTAQRGALTLAVRARSRNGAQQPQKLTFNPSGYHDNVVQTVSVEIV
jgi:sulfite dehydrogenase (cytochrome) subunit A